MKTRLFSSLPADTSLAGKNMVLFLVPSRGCIPFPRKNYSSDSAATIFNSCECELYLMSYPIYPSTYEYVGPIRSDHTMVLFIFIWCFLSALVTPVDVSEFVTRQNCFVNSQYEHRNCQSFVFERILCAIFREHDNNECLRKRASFNPTLTPLGTRINVSRFQDGAKRTFKFHSQYLECVGLRAKENQSISASY